MTRITEAQRCLLADCTRSAIVGWLLTDPQTSQAARRIEHQVTSILGFSFSRFASAAIVQFGGDYRPQSVASDARFPASITEAAALANTIEMDLASPDDLKAAALIAAYSPYGQPEVGTRDWRTYVTALQAIGLWIDEGHPGWREDVEKCLSSFRQAVAAAATVAAE